MTALETTARVRLPAGERAVLEPLITHHPEPVARDHLSEVTGYKRSTRDAYLQRLATRRLIVVEPRGVRANDNLFG